MTMNQINFYSENKTSVDNELLSKRSTTMSFKGMKFKLYEKN